MINPMMLAWTPFDPWHLLVIGMVALLLFGKRLPEVGRSLGRGISEFKKGLKDVGEQMRDDPNDRPKLREGADETARDDRRQRDDDDDDVNPARPARSRDSEHVER